MVMVVLMTTHLINEQPQLEKALCFTQFKNNIAIASHANDSEIIALAIGDYEEQFIIDTNKVDISELKPLLEEPSIKKISNNGSYDWAIMMSNFDIDIETIRCTYLARRVLGESAQYKPREKVLTINKEVLAESIRHTINTCARLCKLLTVDLGHVWKIECEAIAPFQSMSLNGFKFDKEKWSTLIDGNQKEIDSMAKHMNSLAEEHCGSDMFHNAFINFNSPSKVLDLLKRMRIKVLNKDGSIEQISNTNDKTLQLIRNVPLVDMLRRYRSSKKMLTTYGKNFFDKIRHDTGKIHFNLDQYGTATGRPSSAIGSSYNPLNIPKDIRYRSCFIADEDYLIETDDYDSCELRIWAELSGDPNLCEAFLSGRDIHSFVGSKVFNVEVSKLINPDKREIAKEFNYGIAYGMYPSSLHLSMLGKGININLKEVEEFYNNYTRRDFRVGVNYLRNIGLSAIRFRSATSMSGRVRYWNSNYNKNNLVREAGNMKMQGTCSDILKLALRDIYDAIKFGGFRTKILNAPYDEIVTMTHKDDSAEFVKVKRDLMRQAAEFYIKRIPMTVSGKVSNSWIK